MLFKIAEFLGAMIEKGPTEFSVDSWFIRKVCIKGMYRRVCSGFVVQIGIFWAIGQVWLKSCQMLHYCPIALFGKPENQYARNIMFCILSLDNKWAFLPVGNWKGIVVYVTLYLIY